MIRLRLTWRQLLAILRGLAFQFSLDITPVDPTKPIQLRVQIVAPWKKVPISEAIEN